jgi:hypothetical protein
VARVVVMGSKSMGGFEEAVSHRGRRGGRRSYVLRKARPERTAAEGMVVGTSASPDLACVQPRAAAGLWDGR